MQAAQSLPWFWTVEAAVVIALALALAVVARWGIARLRSKVAAQTSTVWDDAVIASIGTPLITLVLVTGLMAALDVVGQALQWGIFELVGPARSGLVIAIVAWFALRLIERVRTRLLERGDVDDPTVIHVSTKLARISVIVVAGLVILDTVGFSIAGILAFGGIGGIAIGFAAKDLLANLFGGLMILLDRPFMVGEWIRSPDRNIEGTVEAIGWRVTRIRTFEKRPLYVPNSIFTSIIVENPSRMPNRRIYETLLLERADAERLPEIAREVEAMLAAHEGIDADQTLKVTLTGIAESGLELMILCFTRTTQWGEFVAIKQDILLRAAEIIRAQGASLAYPTSTVHVHQTATASAGTPLA